MPYFLVAMNFADMRLGSIFSMLAKHMSSVHVGWKVGGTRYSAKYGNNARDELAQQYRMFSCICSGTPFKSHNVVLIVVFWGFWLYLGRYLL